MSKFKTSKKRQPSLISIIIASAILFTPFSSSLCQSSEEAVKEGKRGITFGVLPVVAYDSDLGLQYGLLTNIYWYGDGKSFPQYHHSLYLEASSFNAGTTLLRAYYDSPRMIKGVRTTIDLTWFNDLTTDFYGFNGRKSVFDSNFEDDSHSDYISRVFYKHHRTMTRGMVNLKKSIHDQSPWHWQAGAVVFNMDISPVDIDHLNKKNKTPLPEVKTLYERYVDWGLINQEEKKGGFNPYIKAGIGYDSRDKESFATKGIWTELLLAYAPGYLSSNNYDYGKLTLYHRQYIDLYRKNIVFAYRFGIQHKLWGETPFYLLPHWNTSVLGSATSQGLGGGKTLRGIRRNRIVGDGSMMVNAELRYKFLEFKAGKQCISLGTNIFADGGYITQKFSSDLSQIPENEKQKYFNNKNDAPHYSAGLGIKAALNENFILSIEHGRAMDKEDGSSGLYITMNYLF